ncbi:MAG: hypothetical protein V1885_02125 [Candidatus Brennerbacteria bacterium]
MKEHTEIHARDFVVVRIAVFLEVILRADQRFMSSINGKKFGSLNISRFATSPETLCVQPKWWPKGSAFWVNFSEKSRTFGSSIRLWVPAIPELGSAPFPFVAISVPPFFRPDTFHEDGCRHFKRLYGKVYGVTVW